MRFFQYLQEKYIDRILSRYYKGMSGDIFANPTAKEIRSIYTEMDSPVVPKGTVRYIINFDTKNIYVWRGDLVHSEVAIMLDKDGLIPSGDLVATKFWKSCLAGTGAIQGSKILHIGLSDYQDENPDAIYSAPWIKADKKWLNKWFVRPII